MADLERARHSEHGGLAPGILEADQRPPSRPAVAYAGEPGAFAEDAVGAFFAAPAPIPLPAFGDVFDAVETGRALAGVLPVENVAMGSIREVYDLLQEHELVIVGEVVVPVRLSLAALPGTRLEAVERVYSHVQALGQADRFLRSRPWALLTTYNTAGAAKMVAERREPGAAAVASPRAAELWGLEVLVRDIQSEPENRTRFVVVARPAPSAGGSPLDPAWLRRQAGVGAPKPPMRTTLVFATPNTPGALHRCLGVFAERGFNMSKLESRPSRSRPWEYVFWVDLDVDGHDPATRDGLRALEKTAQMVRVLGIYPRAEEP